jgi:hypothetical protein
MVRAAAQALPFIIAGLTGLAVLLFLISLQQLRRGRTGPYWRLRREAGQRGGQLFLISVTLFVIAVGLAVFTGLADAAYQRLRNALEVNDPNVVHGVVLSSATYPVIATDTPTVTLTVTPTPSETPQPETPTAKATLVPTTTETPTTSPTPTITPTASTTFENVLILTPPTSSVMPLPDAALEVISAALDVSPDGTPVNPGSEFPGQTKRVYLFIQYHDMTPGVTWTRVLYRDGVPIQGQTYSWSLEASGTSYFFFGSADGYPPGHYEVKLFVGSFEISHFVYILMDK